MTYSASENSTRDGSPVELYDFALGPVHYRYTSGDAAVDYIGNSYEAVSIERSAIERGRELNKAVLKINAPRDLAVADRFRVYPPTEVMTLTLYRQHRGDSETAVIWSGRVLNVEWSGSVVVIHCEPVFTSLKRPGLRRKHPRQCPHVVYGQKCQVNQLSRKVAGSITAINGKVISAAAYAGQTDGWFDGGVVEWLTTEGIVERRMVLSHVGTDLTLSAPFVGLAFGATVDAYPGCDHSLSLCDSKFSNSLNYGGFPFNSNSSPFGGKTIY